MAVRHGRRNGDAASNIRSAVGTLLSGGSFFGNEFYLPFEEGAQISMTGEIVACGNGGGFFDSLERVLRTYPSMQRSSGKELAKFSERGVYTVLCGDCDRSSALYESACEAARRGIMKIIVVADSSSERENIFRSLALMCSGTNTFEVSEYRADDYESFVKYKSSAIVYGFLTSATPEILVIGRDSFARKNNIINKKGDGASLTQLISRARPLVFTCSSTVSSVRTLSRLAKVFDPIAIFAFSGEVKHLRDAVIYSPNNTESRGSGNGRRSPEQLGF